MLQVGTVLASRYELLEQIGSGGMAVVFRGMDHKLHREVAVKVMREDFIDDPVQVEKFRKEAHAIAMLTHPNIVGIYDIGTEQGMEYMVKEFVDGITLKDYIRRRHHMTSDEIVKVTLKIAEALKAAHASDIIHRDIKPQNVLVTPKGEVKVTDFGIAKFTKSGTITDHKETMGSVHYLSPEQARGQLFDERSDLYSLGITMYEMATGQPPFDGDTPVSVAMQQLNAEMPSPRQAVPDLWPGLETIIFGLTRKNPNDRYQSAAELIADLKKVYKDPSHSGIQEKKKTPVPAGSEADLWKQKPRTAAQPVSGSPVKAAAVRKEKTFWQKYSIPVLGTVLAVLVLTLAGVIISGLMAAGHTEPGVSYLPNFTGMNMDQARAAVEEAKLNVIFSEDNKEIFSDAYDAGMIVNQEPSAGQQVQDSETITVTLTISKGKREISTVPDYLDNKYETAIQDLIDRGIAYKVEVAEDEGGKNGLIVSQSPKSGTELTPETVVTLYVAVAKEDMATVPNLYNKTEEEARSALAEAGLNVGTITQSTHAEVQEGHVIAQGVESGKQLAKGSTVAITVSSGPYTGDTEQDAGAFLLSADLFAGTEKESGNIKVFAKANGENVTLLDKVYSKEELSSGTVWVKYPAGTKAIRVLLDDAEVLSLSVEN